MPLPRRTGTLPYLHSKFFIASTVRQPGPGCASQSFLHNLHSQAPSRRLGPRFYSSNPVSPLPPTPLAPPLRPLLPRILSVLALSLVLSTATFLMAAAPALPAIQDIISPPTDEDTLFSYIPADDHAASIHEHIRTHPLALSLRANPSFIESHPHMKIPAPMRPHNLTGGTLAGPGRIPVPPLVFLEKGGKSIIIIYYLGADLCGHPGVVHGGLLATILDEGMARCCFPALPNKVGMTANLTVNYRKPLPSESFVVLRAWTRKVDGRKAWVEGRVEGLGDGVEGDGNVFVEANALFIEPRQAKTMARLFPAAAA